MKIEKTITLTEKDRETLKEAAFILKAINDACWTPNQIKELLANQPASVWDVKITWE